MSEGHPVHLVEVGPRDGLQIYTDFIPTNIKIGFIDRLAQSGISEIEVTSFVPKSVVPQMADAQEVAVHVVQNGQPGITYSALVPNAKGFENAYEAGIRHFAVVTAATEEFAQANLRTSIEGTFERIGEIMRLAQQAGDATVDGYISVIQVCPYAGDVAPDAVKDVAWRGKDLGLERISFGETLGKGTADGVNRALELSLPVIGGPDYARLHLHDTSGNAVDIARSAYLQNGIWQFDASAGGIGGCPFAPGAPGNVATEKLADAFMQAGVGVEVDVDAIRDAVAYLMANASEHLS